MISLKWHIDHIAGKISRGIGMIITARQYLNKSGLMCLYHSFIYPYLTNCNHIWGATYKQDFSGWWCFKTKPKNFITHRERTKVLFPCIRNWVLWKLKTSTRISLVILCFVCLSMKSHNPSRLHSEQKQWISLLQYQICPSFTFTFCEIRLKLNWHQISRNNCLEHYWRIRNQLRGFWSCIWKTSDQSDKHW